MKNSTREQRKENKKRLRDQTIKGRIIDFLRKKQSVGEAANSRQISAALDIQRFTIILFVTQMLSEDSIVMTGYKEIHNGKVLPHYAVKIV
ncbi:MAG: hypothetical protein COA54_02345 [Thiotrichaceae bacterium]|nr:MAG: hypothetical protein COA54_02345 [Thiotrichaceae bacterium]